MLNKQDCKYGDNCTFAYHQEEIDVWTEERKGTLNRDLLFDPLGGIKQSSLTIAKLLKEHQGIFTFLCEVQDLGGGVGAFSISSACLCGTLCPSQCPVPRRTASDGCSHAAGMRGISPRSSSCMRCTQPQGTTLLFFCLEVLF